MSSKTATYISLIFILILGSAYFHAANHLSADSGEISNSYFPKLISYILFGLIIISFVTTYLKKEDQKISLPNLKLTFLTIGITAIYVALWSMIGYFYILTFFFIMTLLSTYRFSLGLNVKIVGTNLSIAILTTLFIYLIFDQLMNIKF